MTINIYHLRVYYDKKIYRDIEISGQNKLYKLAETIIQSFEFDLDHCFGFFSNLKGNPTQSLEKYELFADLEDMGLEPVESGSVKKTSISSVFKVGKKMQFLFDYGDDWRFMVECCNITEPVANRKYPYLAGGKGDAPEQYPDYDEELEA